MIMKFRKTAKSRRSLCWRSC